MELSFDAWAYSTQLNEINVLAKTSQTPIVVDHLATPVGLFGSVGKRTGRTSAERADIFEQWKYELEDLAQQKNVYAKISGLMMPVLGHTLSAAAYGKHCEIIDLLTPMIQHAINVFGTDRIIYASNFPMDKPNVALSDLISAYIEMINPYGDHALHAIFRQNAANFYKLNIES
jgi:predicted TIM-barrel fold metal-dependent hydrolase